MTQHDILINETCSDQLGNFSFILLSAIYQISLIVAAYSPLLISVICLDRHVKGNQQLDISRLGEV
jgi:hypothetical protein